jgi:hypothetical protein
MSIANLVLKPGFPFKLGVIVTANSIDAGGVVTGTPDLDTPLEFQYLQGGSTDSNAVVASVDPSNPRMVVLTSGPVLAAGGNKPWSLRIKAAGRDAFLAVSGESQPAPSVSGVFADPANPPGPA